MHGRNESIGGQISKILLSPVAQMTCAFICIFRIIAHLFYNIATMKDISMKKTIFASILLATASVAGVATAAMAMPAPVTVGGAPMYANKNIIQNAVNSKDHTTLVAAVKAAGLVETLSGWAMVSATDRTRQLETLGFIKWPLLPLQDLSNTQLWAIEAAAEWMHWGLVITLLLMIPIHAGAALKHHLIDRDDVFHAMLPVVPLLRPKRTRWQRRWRALEKRVASTARTLWRGLLGPKAI